MNIPKITTVVSKNYKTSIIISSLAIFWIFKMQMKQIKNSYNFHSEIVAQLTE